MKTLYYVIPSPPFEACWENRGTTRWEVLRRKRSRQLWNGTAGTDWQLKEEKKRGDREEGGGQRDTLNLHQNAAVNHPVPDQWAQVTPESSTSILNPSTLSQTVTKDGVPLDEQSNAKQT